MRAALVLACLTPASPGQELPVDRAWLREHYAKSEHKIPMRDGVRLFTTVYAPRGRPDPRPIVLVRTPYSCRPYGDELPEVMDNPSSEFARDGYVIVLQDVRGAYLSEGEFVHMTPHVEDKRPEDVDESTDAFDTIAWLVENVPDNNGRVGLWGMSYSGFYVAASMIDPHPALKCAAPMATQSDWWHEDLFHNGAFCLALVFWFNTELGLPRGAPTREHPAIEVNPASADGYRFFLEEVGPLSNVDRKFFHGRAAFWNDIRAHPNRDSFWTARRIRDHLTDVAPAVLNVGGWFDQSNLYGSLDVYQAIEAQDPDAFNILVMGPWEHGGWTEGEGRTHGDHDFGAPTSAWYRERIQKRFFDFYLEEPAEDAHVALPEATMFDTGANRWREFEAWPPSGLRQRELFLAADGALALDARPTADEGFDAFVSDPARPVPFTDEVVLKKSRTFMSSDQRFAAARADVLAYRSPSLAEALCVAGPIEAELWVSTEASDADWVVKLIDELPDGYQRLVRAEVVRGRFRDDPAAPEPFEPHVPTLVRLRLPDVLHTFQPGHRLMVQIQSSWFPLIDRNPQAWVDSIFEARPEDFVPAEHTVYRSREHASALRLGVLPR